MWFSCLLSWAAAMLLPNNTVAIVNAVKNRVCDGTKTVFFERVLYPVWNYTVSVCSQVLLPTTTAEWNGWSVGRQQIPNVIFTNPSEF
jgi:hypothetical protein